MISCLRMNTSDLSISFLGSSTDRLIRIVGISHGTNLETGNLKERKALIVSEGKVEKLEDDESS
jgi:hypothetical protein